MSENNRGLKAAPSRVILAFQKPEEKSAGGILIPTTSALRPEFGTLVDIGDPTDEQETICRKWILDAAAAGNVFPISYGQGVRYWDSTRSDKHHWLSDVRTYRITEITASVPRQEVE